MNEKENKNKMPRFNMNWIYGIIIVILVYLFFTGTGGSTSKTVDYTQFEQYVKSGYASKIIAQKDKGVLEMYVSKEHLKDVFGTDDFKKIGTVPMVTVEYASNEKLMDLVDEARANNNFKGNLRFEQSNDFMSNIFWNFFPLLFIIAIWVFIMRRMGGGSPTGGSVFNVGKSKAKLIEKGEATRVTFKDVAGQAGAKMEVEEIVEFLKNPKKFTDLGGKIPKGALLVGPPGTGKTLLAKAVAGEANVPFFSLSGSDFVEMFVGVGASRVRDLFRQAKEKAPCIIFIDEIDAVGRQRGAGLGGGNDEREQTLNQMLVEMDGFETGTNIIVIAATNRPDVLDPALLRPGRFDRQVVVPLPDIRGREQILNVHMKKIPVAQDVRADILARGTPGFSGADLANLVNEAALFAARRNGRVVDMNDFELAKDKIMMGAERKSMVMTEDEKRNTAYHESGHALVAKLMPKSDPVHKVTIIPRGRALGVTMQLPEEDHYAYDKQYLLTRIAILFGGRIAEEVFMHQMTTGASNDFERATQMARDMVTRYGMSDSMGVMVYAENEGDPFLGRSLTRTSHISEETMRAVDNEIRRILEEQYTTARKLIEDNADKVEAMAQALLKWETIDADQIDDIMAGKPPREPKVSQPAGAAQPAAPAAVAAAASAQDNGSQPPAA